MEPMSLVEIVVFIALIGGWLAGLAFTGWATYRTLLMTVPGLWRPRSPTRPRIFVEGTPRPRGQMSAAPLSDRPCVAWRLTLVYRGGLRGQTIIRSERYSSADFMLCGDRQEYRVLLHPATTPPKFEDIIWNTPPWRMPIMHSEADFAVELDGADVVLPHSPSLPAGQEQVIDAVVREEPAKHGLTRVPESYSVIETIVDGHQLWACEGPPPLTPEAPEVLTVEASTGITDPSTVVKLAPVQCLGWSGVLRSLPRIPSAPLFFITLVIPFITLFLYSLDN